MWIAILEESKGEKYRENVPRKRIATFLGKGLVSAIFMRDFVNTPTMGPCSNRSTHHVGLGISYAQVTVLQ